MRFNISILVGAVVAGSTLAPLAFAEEAHPVTGEVLAKDQIFTYSIPNEYGSLDPQFVEDVSSSDIVRDLFEGLMNQDGDGNLEPGVALGFQANDGKDVYTFTLRKDARWSNGDPVTAGDFVYAWQRAIDPELASPYAWYMELMSIENAAEIIIGKKPVSSLGITAIGDHVLEIRLTAPLPYFPRMTTHETTFPVHRATVEAHGDEWTTPGNIVSNGAYVLTERLSNERLVRKRNPMYWNDDKTIIERVETLVINDEDAALTRYLAGELDRTDVPTGLFPRLKSEYPDEAFSIPRLCSYYYTFNLSASGPEPFKDVRVRRALSLAVDRKFITENVLAGGQPEAYTFTPAAVAGFEPPRTGIASMSQAERDALASELMRGAGHGPDNPLRFELVYNTSEGNEKIAVAVSRMWRQKLDVEATLTNLEWKPFWRAKPTRTSSWPAAAGAAITMKPRLSSTCSLQIRATMMGST